MKKGVLFLEDDKAQLIIYQQLAKKYLAEYPVYFVKTVQEAEKILNENEINLAVIDLMIPEENGADLIVKMKKNPSYDDVQIIVVSSTEKNSLIYDSLTGYIDEFVTKPIKIEEFSKVIFRYIS